MYNILKKLLGVFLFLLFYNLNGQEPCPLETNKDIDGQKIVLIDGLTTKDNHPQHTIRFQIKERTLNDPQHRSTIVGNFGQQVNFIPKCFIAGAGGGFNYKPRISILDPNGERKQHDAMHGEAFLVPPGKEPNQMVLTNIRLYIHKKNYTTTDFLAWRFNIPDQGRRRLADRGKKTYFFRPGSNFGQDLATVNSRGEITALINGGDKIYHELVFDTESNDYVINKVIETVTGDIVERIPIWRARDGILHNGHRNLLEEISERASGLDISNFIEANDSNDSNDGNKDGRFLTTSNGNHFLHIGETAIEVYSAEDHENLDTDDNPENDEENDLKTVHPSYTIPYRTSNNEILPYLDPTESGILQIKDALTGDIVGEIGESCLSEDISSPKTRFEIMENGAPRMLTEKGIELWRGTPNTIDDDTTNFLDTGGKLIPNHQTPQGNEVNQLVSPDGSKRAYFDGQTIYVVQNEEDGIFCANKSIIQTYTP